MQIDRYDVADAADDGVAAGKDAAVHGTVADRNHPFWIRCRRVSPFQGLPHIFADRTGHHEYIGVSRRSDEAQAESSRNTA